MPDEVGNSGSLNTIVDFIRSAGGEMQTYDRAPVTSEGNIIVHSEGQSMRVGSVQNLVQETINSVGGTPQHYAPQPQYAAQQMQFVGYPNQQIPQTYYMNQVPQAPAQESYLDYIGGTGNSNPAPAQDPITVSFSNALKTTESKLTILAQLLGENYKVNKSIAEKIDNLAAILAAAPRQSVPQGQQVQPSVAAAMRAAAGFPAQEPIPSEFETEVEMEDAPDPDLSGLVSPREQGLMDAPDPEVIEDADPVDEQPTPPSKRPARRRAK